MPKLINADTLRLALQSEFTNIRDWSEYDAGVDDGLHRAVEILEKIPEETIERCEFCGKAYDECGKCRPHDEDKHATRVDYSSFVPNAQMSVNNAYREAGLEHSSTQLKTARVFRVGHQQEKCTTSHESVQDA